MKRSGALDFPGIAELMRAEVPEILDPAAFDRDLFEARVRAVVDD